MAVRCPLTSVHFFCAASDLASAPTFTRLENQLTRKDAYRMTAALVNSYAQPPQVHPDRSQSFRRPGSWPAGTSSLLHCNHCYQPLFVFEGLSGKQITATLRQDKHPTGTKTSRS